MLSSTQIMGAVDAMFLQPLRWKYVGYQKSSACMQHPRAPLRHVRQHQRVNLLANDEQMKSDYNANQPIELFFDQIEDSVVDFAAAGNCPYIPIQVTSIAYQLVFQTGACSLLVLGKTSLPSQHWV
jgi:hypothetical protein